MPDFPALAEIEAPAAKPAPQSLVEPTLELLRDEGFRAHVDPDGDIQLRHEGRDLFVVFDADDPAYVRVLVPDLFRCEASPEQRSIALTVANRLNADLKVVKVSARPDGGVIASVELFVNGFEALRAALPRSLDALGVARTEFRACFREEERRLEEESTVEDEVPPGDPGSAPDAT